VIPLYMYLLLGCISGFLSGLLGVGGGLILVPALLFIFSMLDVIPNNQLMHLSIGTSLACSIVNLIFSVRIHDRNQAIRWPIFFAMAPGVLVGALFLGPRILLMINSDYLKIGFGLFCLLIGIQMIFASKRDMVFQEKLPNNIVISFLGLCIGSISTLLGVAGGVMIGTLLHSFHMDIRNVIGTTAAICIVIAVAGTIGLIFVGYHQPNLPKWSSGFIYWPAFLGIVLPSPFVTPTGAALSHRLPKKMLRVLFAGLVLMIGLRMLL